MTGDRLGLVVLAAALLTALAGAWNLASGFARRAALRARAGGGPPPAPLRRVARAADDRMRCTGPVRRLALRLLAAGARLSALQFVALAAGSALGAYALLSLVFSRPVALIGALVSLRGWWWWLARRHEQRKRVFAAQLPELARLLANAAAAGLSMTAALEAAIAELEDPARRELVLTLEEIRIGQSFERALQHLGERMPSRELAVLVNTLVVQQRSGGDLVRALSDMAETLEARKDTIREVRTVMAGAVTTAYMVAGLGVLSVFVLDLIRAGSLEALTGTALGIAVLLVSGSLYALGFALIRRVTRIET